MSKYWKKVVGTVSFSVILFVCFFAMNTSVFGKTILTKEQTAEYLDKISAYEMSKVTNPGYGSVGGEWLIIGLARYGTLTEEYLNIYLDNLKREVEECNGILSEKKYTEYARVTLALTSIGANPRDFAGYDLLCPLAELDNVIKTGVNGVTFSLLAFDSGNYEIPDTVEGYHGEKSTREKLISILLSTQLKDGGWAYGGSKSDVDMTAMVLQALGKYTHQSKVKTAVNKGIRWLSANQNDSGAFSNAGVENCESTAQVLTAMSLLEIKVSDSRFVKKGKTVLDGLLQFYHKGGFRHTASSYVNQMATEQAMYGLTAYYRSSIDGNSLYDMKDNTKYKKIVKNKKRQSKKKTTIKTKNKMGEKNGKTEERKSPQKSIRDKTNSTKNVQENIDKKKEKKKSPGNEIEETKNNPEQSENKETKKVTGKEKDTKKRDENRYPIGIILVIIVFVGVGILLKKKNKLFIMLLIACITFSGCGKDTEHNAGICTIMVECSTIFDNLEKLDKGLKNHIPEDGIILKEQKVTFQKNDSVYDVLSRELKKNKILMEASFTGKSAYIEGIDNIYEFSCGELSGWLYSVNDQYPQVSCSEYQVKDGDRIRLRYTCDLGEDVKAEKPGDK